MNGRILYTLFFFIFVFSAVAQEDLLGLLDSVQGKGEEPNKVFATFKTTKIISAQSIETVKANNLDFRITHRFGNIGVTSNGGGHTLWGFDNSVDIRFSFDYGITDKIQIGIGRSKMNELIDGSIKYRFLEQTNKTPVSAVVYSCMGLNPQRTQTFYAGTVGVNENFQHRFTYTSQLIIARKFNEWLSLEILPSYMHRNFVKQLINADNNAEEENGLFTLGVGGRIKLSKRVAVLADYFYILSDYRKNNPFNPHYMPLALGIEIETGGHVFHINLTNASGINENNFIPYTNDTWSKGGYKLGFNISRMFTF